jgi:catecholate siderophore receptor
MRGREAGTALRATKGRGVCAIAMLLAGSALAWATCLALPAVSASEANAEESRPPQVRVAQAAGSQLPALTVDQPTPRVQRRRVEVRHTENTTARGIVQRAARRLVRRLSPQPAPIQSPAARPGPAVPLDTQDARTGTAGVYSNSTAVATKTNTPLINIPQSVSVLAKSFIQDQSVQNLTELTRYVPGIAIHQGEGNRDELVIRGVDSSANIFVNVAFATMCRYSATCTIRKASKS